MNSFLPSKHLVLSSFTKIFIVRSCSLLTEEKGRERYYFLLRDLSEVLEDKIKPEISQKLKQREELDCTVEAWREPCFPSGDGGDSTARKPHRGPSLKKEAGFLYGELSNTVIHRKPYISDERSENESQAVG